MLIVVLTLGLTLFAVCGALTLAHSGRVGRVTLLDWSLLAFGAVYGLAWCLVILTMPVQSGLLVDWVTQSRHLLFAHTIAAFLSMGGMVLGWYLAPIRRSGKRRLIGGGGLHKSFRDWRLIAWAMLLAGIFVHVLYSFALGGPISALEYSRIIRAGFEVNNPLSFLRPLAGLALISSFVFFGLYLSKARCKSDFFGNALAFSVSLFILYSWMGRMGFIIFLAVYPLSFVLARERNPLRAMFIGLLIVALSLLLVYGISIWLNIKPANDIVRFFGREFMFPFASFFAHWAEGFSNTRLFLDLIAAPVHLLPSSITRDWVTVASEINTTLVTGAPKGDGQTAGIPVDIISLGMMQFHVPGVFLVGSLFGAILRFAQSLLDRIEVVGVRATLEAYVALKIAVMGLFYAQPELFIPSNIALIALVIFAWIVKSRHRVAVRMQSGRAVRFGVVRRP
jgi:hypothetical protein